MIKNERQLIQLIREAMDFSGLKGLKKNKSDTTSTNNSNSSLKQDSQGSFVGKALYGSEYKKSDELGYRGGSNADGTKPSAYVIAKARQLEKDDAEKKFTSGLGTQADFVSRRNELISMGLDPDEALLTVTEETPSKNWKKVYENPDPAKAGQKCNIYVPLKDLPRDVQKELIKDDYDGIHYVCKGKNRSTPRRRLPEVFIFRDEQIDGVTLAGNRIPKQLQELGIKEIEVEPGLTCPIEASLTLPNGHVVEYLINVNTFREGIDLDGVVYAFFDEVEQGLTVKVKDTIDVVAGDLHKENIRTTFKTDVFNLKNVNIELPSGETVSVSPEDLDKYTSSHEEIITIDRTNQTCIDRGIEEIDFSGGVTNHEIIEVADPAGRPFYIQVILIPRPIDFAKQRKEYIERIATYANDYDLPKGPSTFVDDVKKNFDNLLNLMTKYYELHFDNYFFANRLTKRGRMSKTAQASKYYQNVYGDIFQYNYHGLGGYAVSAIIPEELAKLRPETRGERTGVISRKTVSDLKNTEGLDFLFDKNPQVEQKYDIEAEPAVQDFFFKIKKYYKNSVDSPEECERIQQELYQYEINLRSYSRKFSDRLAGYEVDNFENVVRSNLEAKYNLRQLSMSPEYRDNPMSHPMVPKIALARAIPRVIACVADLYRLLEDIKTRMSQKVVTPKDLTGPSVKPGIKNENKQYSLMNVFYPNHKKSSQISRKSQFTKRY